MKRSDSYVMTADYKCAGSMLEIENVRTAVKAINKINKQKEKAMEWRYDNGYTEVAPVKLPRYRVKLQGRGPRRALARSLGHYASRFDQSLPLPLAERVDVYVYENHTW